MLLLPIFFPLPIFSYLKYSLHTLFSLPHPNPIFTATNVTFRKVYIIHPLEILQGFPVSKKKHKVLTLCMPFELYFSKGGKKMNISLKFYIQRKNKDSNFIPFLTSIKAIMRHYIHSYLEKYSRNSRKQRKR